MLAALKRLVADLAGPEPPRLGEDDRRLAAAALLYHVTTVDGVVTDEERAKLRELLASRFGLDAAATEALVKAAEEADNEAVDLYGFTSILTRTLDQSERERIVKMMWELVFADGRLDEFEDNIIWRIAELLSVPSEARIRLKQAARNHA